MKKLNDFYNNLDFAKKIILLIVMVGVLPLGALTAFTAIELKRSTDEKQIFAINKGYDQIHQALANKINRIHNISTLIAVNDTINLVFQLENDETSIVEQLAAFESVSSYSNAIEMSGDYGQILYFINDSFVVATDTGGRYRPLSGVADDSWVQELNQNHGLPTWVSFNKNGSIVLARSLWDNKNYEKSLGILAIELNADEIKDIFIESVSGQLICLETQSGQALASNNNGSVSLPVDLRRPSHDKFYMVSFDGEAYMARSDTINHSGLSLVSMIPLSVINTASNTAVVRIVAAYGIILIVIFIIIFPFTNKLLQRIRLIGEQMKNISSDPKPLVAEENTDEIGTLVKNYNSMIKELDELLVKQFELGQEKVGAELKALQSQINPHFLYNTLDMVNWMALKNENENICEVIQAMSSFYRLTLSRGDDIISLRDELRMCEAYIDIQQKKFKGRIQFTTDIEEEAYNCLIPKITLQPLLENAIIHGINERSDARGAVTVSGWIETERLIISVTDNGVGMDWRDKFKDNPQGSHYGIMNIEKRLSLYYKEPIETTVESVQGIGTCVSFNIPIRRGSVV